MGVESHYRQKLEQLQGPRLTSDLGHLARRLFDAASGDVPSSTVVPPPVHFSDNVEASHVYWRLGEENQDHEFFGVRLVGRSLSFALQHRHSEALEAAHTFGTPFVDHQRAVLVVGAQRPAIFAHDGMRDRGRRDALVGRETDLPAFRQRLDHTMAAIGIHESIPDMVELRELLLAS